MRPDEFFRQGLGVRNVLPKHGPSRHVNLAGIGSMAGEDGDGAVCAVPYRRTFANCLMFLKDAEAYRALFDHAE